MNYLLSGIGFGLTLSIMIGPIFFALLNAAIDRGFRAGAMVGLGVWVSDFSFILLVYYGLSHVRNITSMEGFKFYTGLTGSIILLSFGLATIFRARKEITIDNKEKLPLTWLSLFLKGFLINTVNPFTVFFWLSVISSVVIQEKPDGKEALYFLFGIFTTILITDLFKVGLAKNLRHWMKPSFVITLKFISGIALVSFGVVLLFNSISN